MKTEGKNISSIASRPIPMVPPLVLGC